MTVGELKKELADVDGALLVVMSKDAEGNAFSPLDEYGVCHYTANSTWSGDIKAPSGEPDQDPDDWDPETDEVNAICLWPVN